MTHTAASRSNWSQVARRAVGEEIKALLNDTEDLDHLAKVAELVISAGSGRELADAVTAFLRANHRPNAS